MYRGYIKLWRKSLDSKIFTSETLWHIWTWCLMKANHTKKNVFFKTGRNGVTVTVKSGSFIFGRHTASEELNKPGSTIWYNIKKLEDYKAIKVKSNKQYSIIYILNWKDYQQEVDKQLTGNEQATDKQLTGNGQATDTTNNVKNGKNGKNVKNDTSFVSKKLKREDDRQLPIDKKLSKHLMRLILKRKPDYREHKKQKRCAYIKWARYIRLMREQDGRKPEGISEVIKWCQQDDFWQDNILSTSKLREQFDKLELKMRKKGITQNKRRTVEEVFGDE